jgi:predicted alpha/beta-hydrolase family hydrolase
VSPTWAVREITTTVGLARVRRCSPRGAGGAPVLVLGHGAGGGVDAPDLTKLAAAAIATGWRVVLVEQPWRVASRRIAPRPEVLDDAWVQVLAALRLRGPVVVGGRSAGARVACRTARQVGADAILCVAFPLHPPARRRQERAREPDRPHRSRVGELEAVDVPVVVVQGDRDPFGSADELGAAAPGVTVVPVPGGDHGLSRGALEPALQEALRHVREAME